MPPVVCVVGGRGPSREEGAYSVESTSAMRWPTARGVCWIPSRKCGGFLSPDGRENVTGRTEHDLIDRLLSTMDRRTGDVTGLVKGFMANPPRPLPSGEREEANQRIEQEVAEESGLDQLADELFYR